MRSLFLLLLLVLLSGCSVPEDKVKSQTSQPVQKENNMLSINQVYLGGNLVRDIELRKVGDKQTSVANFSLAINSRIKDQDATFFANCEIWGSDAEDLANNFKKGNELVVFGSMKTDKYVKEGVEKTFTKIRVNRYGRGIADLLGLAEQNARVPQQEVKSEKATAPKEESTKVEDQSTEKEATPF